MQPKQGGYVNFIPNLGQWDGSFLFRSSVPSGDLFIEKNSVTYCFYDSLMYHKLHQFMHNGNPDGKDLLLNYHAVRLQFLNSNPDPHIYGKNKRSEYHNYYLGNDRTRWKSGVPLFTQVYYENIYEGIDLEFYGLDMGIKYNFIVHPGADVNDISIRYEGASGVFLKEGKLHIKTSVNEVVEETPYTYQYANGKVKEIRSMFTLNERNELGIKLLEDYDKTAQLIIDPVVVFATYSGSTTDNFGFTAANDTTGNMYTAGITTGNGYPVTPGAFQKTFKGGYGGPPRVFGVDGADPWDITISKYTPHLDTLIYATYLGGNDNEFPQSLVVDYSDCLVLLGSSFSTNFPVTKQTFDTSYNGNYNFPRNLTDSSDIVLCRFSSDGTVLLASTYIGGSGNDGVNDSASRLTYNYADEFRGDIIPDKDNNYYIGTCSKSTNFPVKNPLISTLKGKIDGIVFKIDSSLQNLAWSTYFGGADEDAIYSIDLDKNKNIFVSGGTTSSDLPTNSKAYQKNALGGVDGFAASLTNDGQAIKALTYIGTNKYDQAFFIEFDAAGHVFVAGQTEGSMPTTSGVYKNSSSGQFIIKLSNSLDTLLAATVIGAGRGQPDISPTAFLVDNCGFIYLSGWGSDIGPFWHKGTTTGLPVSSSAYQSTTDGNDFYLIALDRNMTGLLYATFFGGNNSEDHVDGGTSRFDKRGVVYESVCASCPPGITPISDFPTTPGAKFPINLSPRCSNAGFKLDFQLQSAVIADFRETPRIACFPTQIAFTNTSNKGKKFIWDFGDLSPLDSVNKNPVHNFPKAGKYRIMLVAIDSNTCNFHDTTYDEVTLIGGAVADFEFEAILCEKKVTFKNKMENALSFVWEFGDGSVDSINQNPEHIYAAEGVYSVKLSVNKNTDCADSLIKIINFDSIKEKPLLVPNVFTPTGDKINDKFEIQGINPLCDSFSMVIYNRWGKVVFTTKDVNVMWDGLNKKGEEYPAGVYYYFLEVSKHSGKKYSLRGDVTLVR